MPAWSLIRLLPFALITVLNAATPAVREVSAAEFKVIRNQDGFTVDVPTTMKSATRNRDVFLVREDRLNDATSKAVANDLADKKTFMPDAVVEFHFDSSGNIKLREIPKSVQLAGERLRAKAGAYVDQLNMFLREETTADPKAVITATAEFEKMLAETALAAATSRDKAKLLSATLSQQALGTEKRVVAAKSRQIPKFQYLSSDIFTADAYEKMLSNLQRGAGVYADASPSTQKTGSGLFIGPNLVLTAAHVAYLLNPGSAVVRRRTPAGNVLVYTVDDVLLRGDLLPPSDAAYGDVALLRVSASGDLPPFPPLRLAASARTISSYDPLYVVSFNEAHRPFVLDAVSVIFPEQVRGERLGQVLMNGVGRYLETPTVHSVVADLPDDLMSIANAILGAYSCSTATFSASNVYTFRQALDTVGEHPRCGFNSDTRPGDSGSGVFFKRSGDLIGVFSSGSRGNLQKAVADWVNHEQSVGLEVVRAFLVRYDQKPVSEFSGPKPAIDISY